MDMKEDVKELRLLTLSLVEILKRLEQEHEKTESILMDCIEATVERILTQVAQLREKDAVITDLEAEVKTERENFDYKDQLLKKVCARYRITEDDLRKPD